MSVAIPTAADLAAASNGEIYGLRNVLQPGETDWTAADLFVHGRDYFLSMPDSPTISQGQDQAQFVRTYRLLADNLFTGTTWAGRNSYCTPERVRLFLASLVGYPYVLTTLSKFELYRHLPEPYKAGKYGDAWTWVDDRLPSPNNAIRRYELHASRILHVRGLKEEGQGVESNVPAATWNPNTQSAIWNPAVPGTFVDPNEGYDSFEVQVLFERLPYNVLKRSDPGYGGEYSRFTTYNEDASARALQVRAGVIWDGAAGQGQPAAGGVPDGTLFSSLEGAPRLTGENTITWTVLDVPLYGFNWANPAYTNASATSQAIGRAGMKAYFGYVNNPDFGAANKLPVIFWNAQSVLFRTCRRMETTSCIGQPLYQYTFLFQHSPADDGQGYWNRLLNPNGVYQRYRPPKPNGADNWYPITPFDFLFQSRDYYPFH